MTFKVILNPYANRWRAQNRVSMIVDAFKTANLEFDLYIGSQAGSNSEVAYSAAKDGYSAVIAAGGDGTVNEVVNGLIQATGSGPTVPLGVIPIGTGNDFNDMTRLPRDINQSVQVIAGGVTRQIDAGQVTADGSRHYFGNNCALAMEPMVTIENNRIRRLSGNVRYIVAVLKALRNLRSWHMSITWDGGGFTGEAILLSICNNARTGGIFPMAPGARPDDGLFDYVLASQMSKARVLWLLPHLLRGTHIDKPMITTGRTSSLTIECEPSTPIHADGEVISTGASQIKFDVLPGKITLLTTF